MENQKYNRFEHTMTTFLSSRVQNERARNEHETLVVYESWLILPRSMVF